MLLSFEIANLLFLNQIKGHYVSSRWADGARRHSILIVSIQSTLTYNHVFNHVGIAVPDLEAAIEWYTTNLGFRRLQKGCRAFDRASDPDAPIFKVYGDSLHKVKIAPLSSGNGVGVELFQFIDPPVKKGTSFKDMYTRGGYFHICITHPDPDTLLKKISSTGAKQIGETIKIGDEKALYMSDPWGNVIEVLSCSFEQLMANK
jgi:catechol 2,3-dioxygenase-like lactoylglutathione lyase family enzyme